MRYYSYVLPSNPYTLILNSLRFSQWIILLIPIGISSGLYFHAFNLSFLVANPQFDPQLRVFFLVSSIRMKRNIQNIDYLHFENGKSDWKSGFRKTPHVPSSGFTFAIWISILFRANSFIQPDSVALLKFTITSSGNKEISVLVYITLDSVPTYISSS